MAADSVLERRKYLSSLRNLIMEEGTEVLQNVLCQRLNGVALDDFLARERVTIMMLSRNNSILQRQINLLYRSALDPLEIKNLNITLIAFLLKNIPSLRLNIFMEADISQILYFRNEFVDISPTEGISYADFKKKLTKIENVLLSLNSTLQYPILDLKQTIDGYKCSLKDPVREQSIEISNEPGRMEREMLQIKADLFKLKQDTEKKGVKNNEQNLSYTLIYARDTKQNEDNIKQNVTDFKQDIEDRKKEIKDLYDILEKSGEENVENIPKRQQIIIMQCLKNIEQHLRDLEQKQKNIFKYKVDVKNKNVNTLQQEDISARNKRLEDMFQSKNDMKGRLKILTAQNIKDLLESCGSKPKYEGGFGDIFVSKTKIPVLRMKIIVKRIQLKNEEEEQTMRSFTNDKLCARSLHFAIVPLLGIREDSENRIFYFLSPYMENGNLNKFIEEDSERLKSKEMPVLHPGRRTRILFQIASAIDFLHTPLRDIRGIIIHRDIKSFNIVLDGAFNARLIDFGLAREMKDGHDETKTTSKYYFTLGYGKKTQQHILAKHDDYRCFGVVIRELLTGEKAYVKGRPAEALIEQIPDMIEMKLLDMWKKLEVIPSVSKALVTLSTQCINKKMSSGEILKTLKDVLRNMNAERWENLNEDEKLSKKCEMCLENPEKKDVLTHHTFCQNSMKVCVSCMRNSYCNPIHCHSCDATIHPKIGHGWAALLIAGDDENESVAEMFKEDVDAVFKVITSKCPLVMGVRAENVQIIKPAETMKKKKQDAVDALQNVDEIHTLFVYVSSHYIPEDGGFLLKSKPERQFISISELQCIIAKVLGENEKRAIVLFDCCYAPAITIAQTPPPDGENIPAATASPRTNIMENELMLKLTCIRIVQMNACRPNQEAVMEQGGSLFRKLLLQGLTRNALGEECELCPKDQPCSLQGDFVTVEKLLEYITLHCSLMKSNCVTFTHNVAQRDSEIGYVINFRVDLQVTYKYRDKIDQDRIPQNMFGTLSELQIVLFNKYLEKMGLDKQCGDELKLSTAEFYEILCIEVEKGPKNHQRDRLTTLERIIAAWNAKRELVVTLRELNEVTEGPVGIFLPSGQTVEPILDMLQDEEITQDEHATTCHIQSHNFESFFEKTKTTQKEKPECSSVKAFSENAIYLANALHKQDKTEKDRLKEIQIIFPCAFVNGARQYRMDFLCYKVVKHEDG